MKMGEVKQLTNVLRVEKHGGKIQSVEIMAGPFEITFAEVNGRVRKISITRSDKNMISSASELWVPPHLFRSAIRRACGIFGSNRIA